jgi:4-hydroxythreonine-4-phosphate dehydrogenase
MSASKADRGHVLAVTVGEPAGIGPDITLAAWLRRNDDALPAFAVFGDPAMLAARACTLGLTVPIATVDEPGDGEQVFPTALPVIALTQSAATVPGRPDPANGAATIAAVERATHAVTSGRALALVTNPIAKSVLYRAGFHHPGHTEFLAELAHRHFPGQEWSSVMMLVCDELRVVPLTIHISLAAVLAAVTKDLIQRTAHIVERALRVDFGIERPRIAVTGLNPHAGEDGTMGTEDRDIIRPAIEALAAGGMAITGPHSADTMFHAGARARYDAAIAMYHDQALIPIKTLAFDRGVNVTLGLPFVRTSPDHGTAFDIAGTGQARAESFIEALRLARRMGLARASAASSDRT